MCRNALLGLRFERRSLVLLGGFPGPGAGLPESIGSRRVTGNKWIPGLAGSLALLFATACLLAASGCGGNGMNNPGNGTQRGMATVMVTGTSGNLTHSTSVSLTVQ